MAGDEGAGVPHLVAAVSAADEDSGAGAAGLDSDGAGECAGSDELSFASSVLGVAAVGGVVAAGGVAAGGGSALELVGVDGGCSACVAAEVSQQRVGGCLPGG